MFTIILHLKTKPFLVISLLTLLVFIFYGKALQTWFQQDEWDLIGRFAYFNSQGNIPFLKAFTAYLFPHPRFAFAPLYSLVSAILVWLFGTNFMPYMVASLLLHITNSFLVYIYIGRMSQNKGISLLTSILFATSGIGQKAVTWIATSYNTQLACTFSLLSLILLDKFFKEKKFSYLNISAILLLTALLFKETALSAILILPALLLIYRKPNLNANFYKLAFKTVTIFLISYFVVRFTMTGVSQYFHLYTYSYELPRFLTLKEYILTIFWSPLRAIVDILLVPKTIYSFAYQLSTLLWINHPAPFQNTSEFGSFAENKGVDILTVLLFILIIYLLYYLYNKLKGNDSLKTLFLLGLTFIFSSIVPSLLLTIRGTESLVHIFRSRDLYLSTIGSSTILALGLNYFWFHFKRLQPRFLLISLFFLFLFYNWTYINKTILEEEVQRAEVRKSIVTKIYELYPKLPQKVIFYTTSDTPYYGYNIPSMPFQTGFGRVLLVWYSLSKHDLPYEFMSTDFLYLPQSQGYKEIGNFGFGYFTDFSKLKKTLAEYKLSSTSIIAFDYFGKDNIIHNETDKYRRILEKNDQ